MIPRPVLLRPLTTDDEAVLRAFECAQMGAWWTAVVEEMVQEHLVGALPTLEAVGLFVEGELSAVTAWRVDSDLCRSIVIAVRSGCRRRGFGRLLKEHILAKAVAAGATAVVSHVHWDNDGMLALNERFGATIKRIPGDDEYCYCVIPLRGGRGTSFADRR